MFYDIREFESLSFRRTPDGWFRQARTLDTQRVSCVDGADRKLDNNSLDAVQTGQDGEAILIRGIEDVRETRAPLIPEEHPARAHDIETACALAAVGNRNSTIGWDPHQPCSKAPFPGRNHGFDRGLR